jgi:hypothetical protein
MLCKECGAYYRQSPYNDSDLCDDCFCHEEPKDSEDKRPKSYPFLDSLYMSPDEVQDTVNKLKSKDGVSKTKPIFYD